MQHRGELLSPALGAVLQQRQRRVPQLGRVRAGVRGDLREFAWRFPASNRPIKNNRD